jgi:hypothetical protein
MYFLKKFDAIPEDQWITGELVDDLDRKCVLGHCGCRSFWVWSKHTPYPKEAAALQGMVYEFGFGTSIVNVNDGIHDSDSIDPMDLGSTPKERIMNLLFLINAGVKS